MAARFWQHVAGAFWPPIHYRHPAEFCLRPFPAERPPVGLVSAKRYEGRGLASRTALLGRLLYRHFASLAPDPNFCVRGVQASATVHLDSGRASFVFRACVRPNRLPIAVGSKSVLGDERNDPDYRNRTVAGSKNRIPDSRRRKSRGPHSEPLLH